MLLRHFLLLVLPLTAVSAIRPKFSWDYVGNMSFVHLCNESGLFNDEALDAIVKFPFVTIEKGQGFNAPCPAGSTAPCAETKIIAQLAAVKARDPTISTVFYMNAVISWYFYHMDTVMRAHRPWQLNQSANGQAVMVSGDKHFNPPKSGMFVYAHNVKEMQDYWIEVCLNATKTPFVDGCFSDSSQPGSHKTGNYLNKKDEAAYEAGKVATMSKVTAAFGGKAGKPYTGSTGVLIGKKSYQDGINAYQIEYVFVVCLFCSAGCLYVELPPPLSLSLSLFLALRPSLQIFAPSPPSDICALRFVRAHRSRPPLTALSSSFRTRTHSDSSQQVKHLSLSSWRA
tara:strand:+ start:305 stop:1327 length:1023 start_codon:yes stop_codon:yes gene_type:complete